MSAFNHRICERCWFDSAHGRLSTGAYRMPVQVKDSEPGTCCYCAGVTITGIFRRDTRTVCLSRHPKESDDSQ